MYKIGDVLMYDYFKLLEQQINCSVQASELLESIMYKEESQKVKKAKKIEQEVDDC